VTRYPKVLATERRLGMSECRLSGWSEKAGRGWGEIAKEPKIKRTASAIHQRSHLYRTLSNRKRSSKPPNHRRRRVSPTSKPLLSVETLKTMLSINLEDIQRIGWTGGCHACWDASGDRCWMGADAMVMGEERADARCVPFMQIVH